MKGRIIRVFPRRTKATPTDAMAFIGEPPLPTFLPEADEVHVSVTFTWDVAQGRRLVRSWERFYPIVKIGGPAMGDRGGMFSPGMYLRPGYTITSRGCPRRCPFCLVPKRERGIRELSPIAPGTDVLDNNLLACSDRHIMQVLEMLGKQKRRALFTGGLEAARITPTIIEQLQSLRIERLFTAYDSPENRVAVLRAIGLMRRAGLSRDQSHCYVLAGFYAWDTPDLACVRCEEVLEAGGIPFMMLYQPADGVIDYKHHRLPWWPARRKYIREPAMMPKGRRAKLEAVLARKSGD